jgi:hypothetical protein
MSDQHQRLPPADFRIDEMGRAMAQGIVAGIDWASDVHVACLLDADGAVSVRFSFTHDFAAIRSMVGRLRAAGVAGVAIERGDGPVVEELLAAGLAVFVVQGEDADPLDPRLQTGNACRGGDQLSELLLWAVPICKTAGRARRAPNQVVGGKHHGHGRTTPLVLRPGLKPGRANHGEDLTRNGHRGPHHQVLARHPCRD